MRATRILETVIYARDIAAARDFYEKVIGLTFYSEAEGRFVFFRCGDQMLLIFNPDITSRQSTGSGPPPHGTAGAGHVCFRSTASQLVEWRQHLEAHALAIETVIDWPRGGRSIYCRDPAGNSVEFAEGAIWGFAEMRTLAGGRIVIATHNKGKLAEFTELLKPHGVTAVSAGELGLAEPEETGTTFAANARIKAMAAMQASGLIALADDSGLCVEALNGEPGVYTAGWAGPNRDWNRAMRLVEEKLQAQGAATPGRRHAAFVCTLCVLWPDGEERIFEGRVHGHLTWPPRGNLGHGYDPMFVPEGQTRTFAELDPTEKNKISHRARALEKLVHALL